MIKHNIEPGMRFGMLTAICDLHKSDAHGEAMWLFRCECGNEKAIRKNRVASGCTKSCGCKRKYLQKKHGMHGTDLYLRWKGMNQRCAGYDDVHKRRYTNRGVKVCDEWKEFLPFYEWAIRNGYQKGLTLDRIDNNGNYEPRNCRWATVKQQANNKETTIRIQWNGEDHSISEWAELLHINKSTLYRRYRKGECGNHLFRGVST